MQPVLCPVHAGKSVKELSNSALSDEFSSQQRADGSVTSFRLYDCMFTFFRSLFLVSLQKKREQRTAFVFVGPGIENQLKPASLNRWSE